MVIDTSAVLAWLKQEPERERITAALESHPVCLMPAVSVLEAHIVVQTRGHPTMRAKLQPFLDKIGAIVVPCDEPQAKLANVGQ
jgi:ribonuclease VapC